MAPSAFDASRELLRKWFETFIQESKELAETYEPKDLTRRAVELAGDCAHHPCCASPGQQAPVHILDIKLWSRVKFDPILAYGHIGDAIPLWVHYYRFLKDCSDVLQKVKTDG
jgi:hypothetical protein